MSNSLKNMDELDFDFMLKEYEGINKKISQHFDSAEKSYRIYVLVIAAALSFLGILYKSSNNFEIVIFSFNKYQLLPLAVIFIFGVIIFFKIIEHRLLITTYIRSLNLNKKWFANRSSGNLSDYIFFDIGGHSPAYFLIPNHNFWEAIGLSFLNASLGAILLINFLILSINTPSHDSFKINIICTVIIIPILIFLQMSYYYCRANKLNNYNETRLSSRNISKNQPEENIDRKG